MTKKTIWALTSVACDYAQPPHNLEGWWAEKPTAEQLALAVYPDTVALSPYQLETIAELLETGGVGIPGQVDYELIEWSEAI